MHCTTIPVSRCMALRAVSLARAARNCSRFVNTTTLNSLRILRAQSIRGHCSTPVNTRHMPTYMCMALSHFTRGYISDKTHNGHLCHTPFTCRNRVNKGGGSMTRNRLAQSPHAFYNHSNQTVVRALTHGTTLLTLYDIA